MTTSRATGSALRNIFHVCLLVGLPWTLSCSCATSQPGSDSVSTSTDLSCDRDADCVITDKDPEHCCAQCREPYAVARATREKWCLGPTNCLAILEICGKNSKSPRDYTAVCSRHKCERRSKWW